MWEAHGRAAGSGREDWLEAKRTLRDEMRWSETGIAF
jgi:hypothetical protein